MLLAIESSCDETGAAVVDRNLTVLSNIVASQADLHQREIEACDIVYCQALVRERDLRPGRATGGKRVDGSYGECTFCQYGQNRFANYAGSAEYCDVELRAHGCHL